MFRAVMIISVLITLGIVGYLAKERKDTVPSAVTDVLPPDEGEPAPETMQQVPKHIQNKLNKLTDKHQQQLDGIGDE